MSGHSSRQGVGSDSYWAISKLSRSSSDILFLLTIGELFTLATLPSKNPIPKP